MYYSFSITFGYFLHTISIFWGTKFEMSHTVFIYYVNCDARRLSERSRQFPAGNVDEVEHTPLRELAATIM